MATTTNPPPKVGDILRSSWGYDQTNIDFYKVVGVTKASVKITKIGKTYLPGAHGDSTVKVVPNVREIGFAPVKTKRVREHWSGKGYTVNISDYASASLWDGEPEHETASGYGH